MSLVKTSTRVGAAGFVLGISLAGPQAAGVAAADSTDSGSTVTSAAAADSTTEPRNRATRRAARPVPATAPLTPAAASSAPDQGNAVRSAAGAAAPRAAARSRSGVRVRAEARATTDSVRTPSGDGVGTTSVPVPDITASVHDTLPATGLPVTALPAPSTVSAVAPSAAPRAFLAASAVTAAGLPMGSAAAAAAGNWLSALFAPIQAFVEGIGLLVRRTFFNAPPTVNPVQITGQTSGTITGTIGAVDAEGDAITYNLVQAPGKGTVAIATDGTYTYTPGAGFTGTDTFLVAAADGGLHINLLDLFRPAATEAFVRVAQGATQSALSFNFLYGSGARYWTPAARAALQAAADTLAAYFVVSSPVTLTFNVTGTNSFLSSTLASAGSDLVEDDPGFFATVVQQKIITGVDSNGSAVDGDIDWNFGPGWGLGATVPNGQYDFTSTAMHELMHTFGFLSNITEPGTNTGRNWTTFDGFVSTSTGTRVIGDSFAWNNTYTTNLTGGNGGLFFNGPNAVAVYGGPVPLYTPKPWEGGSSMSHLNDSSFTGRNDKIMNAKVSMGQGIRVISPLELAMMQDLGYTVNNQSTWAFLLLGFGMVGRRRSR